MKPIICLVLFALCLASASHGQTKSVPNSSLKETVTWMENFTWAHGIRTLNTGQVRHDAIHSESECVVVDEISVSSVKNEAQPSVTIVTLSLSDLAPNAVRLEIDKSEESYAVEFERSDASAKIEMQTETSDGKKQTYWIAQEQMFFDSEDSAKRFSRALIRAINLCGGKPAPY